MMSKTISDYLLLLQVSMDMSNNNVAGTYCREAINTGKADFVPISVSELPLFYRQKHVDLDYALVTVTPPDKHGFCSLGASVGSARSAIQNAKRIIGRFNHHPFEALLCSASESHAACLIW